MNKNTILILFIVVITVAAYFFFVKDATSPVINEVETIEEIENSDYVGMTIVEANAKAQAEGVMFRVVIEDGQPRPITKDFQEGRISATVKAGLVTEYTVETLDYVPVDNMDTEPVSHDAIIGMTTAEAKVYAETNGVDFRTGTIDGEPMAVTMDFRPGRITAEIADDIVIGYSVEW